LYLGVGKDSVDDGGNIVLVLFSELENDIFVPERAGRE
jgi:hypothetical protein